MEAILFIILMWGLIALFDRMFFIKIDGNHMVAASIFGRPLHMLCSTEDKKTITDEIAKKRAILDAANALAAQRSTTKRTVTLQDLGVPADFETWLTNAEARAKKIICREESWLWGIFVRYLNRHFIFVIPRPFTSFKKTIVLSNKPAEETTQAESIEKRIVRNGVKKTIFLRIVFPRIGLAPNRQFVGNIRNHLVWTINRVVIMDPHYIYWESPDVSLNVDTQVNAALNNLASTFVYSAFQAEDTGSGENRLNRFMRDEPTQLNDISSGAKNKMKFMIGGLFRFGFSVDSIGILDYELGKEETVLADAMAEQQAAAAKLVTARLVAEGKAAGVELPGMAEARVRTAMTRAMGNDPAVLAVYEASEQAKGNITTLVQRGGAAGVQLAVQANQPPQPSQQNPQGQQQRQQHQQPPPRPAQQGTRQPRQPRPTPPPVPVPSLAPVPTPAPLPQPAATGTTTP